MTTDMLTLQEEEFVDRKVKNYGLSKLIAYLLWIFFGILGGHRYYTGRIKSGIAMSLLYIIGAGAIWFSIMTTIFPAITTENEFYRSEDRVQTYRYNRQEAHPQFEGLLRQIISQHKISFSKNIIIVSGGILAIMWLWWLIDAFFLAGIVNRRNEALWNQYATDVLKRRQNESGP